MVDKITALTKQSTRESASPCNKNKVTGWVCETVRIITRGIETTKKQDHCKEKLRRGAANNDITMHTF